MLFCLVETSQKHECLVRCAAHQATRLPEVGRWKLPSGLGTKPSGAWHSRRTCPLLLLDLKQVYFKTKSKCLNVQMCSIQPTEFKFQCPLNYLQIELKGCAKYGRERKILFATKEVLTDLYLNKIKILSTVLNIYYFIDITKI